MPGQDGLALGPQVRSRRAHLRRCIQEGHTDLAEMLEGEDPSMELIALSMQVGDLASCHPQLDVIAAGRVLAHAGVLSSTSRLGDLTIERRRAIAAAIRRECK